MNILFVASDIAESVAFPKECRFVFTGVGQALASANLAKAIMERKPDMVINVGTVGGVTQEIGTVLEVKQVFNLDQDLTAFHVPPATTLGVKRDMLGGLTISEDGVNLATSSAFSSEVTSLMKTLCIDICDMETYAEAVLCKTLGIDFRAFKVVTDKVGEKTKLKDYKTALKNSREQLCAVVLERFGLC